MPETETDLTVLDDPLADEAYTYLRRFGGGLTDYALAEQSGISPTEAGTGLRLLVDAGLAVARDDTFFAAENADEADAPPPPSPTTREAVAEMVPDPPAVDALTRLTPDVVLALARGEHVRLLVRGWAEVVEGQIIVREVLAVEEARMPGERPIGS